MHRGLQSFLLLCMAFLASGSKKPIASEAEFLSILDNFSKKLQNLTQTEMNKPLIATGDWNKPFSPTSAGGSFYYPTVNGVIHRGVHIVGWVAKFDGFGRDENELVLCHELGHHAYSGGQEWEADYFITNKCLPILWAGQKHEKEYTQSEVQAIPKKIRQQCEVHEDPTYCYRTIIAFIKTSDFRAWVWRKLNVNINAVKENNCRMGVLWQGLREEEFVACEN